VAVCDGKRKTGHCWFVVVMVYKTISAMVVSIKWKMV